MKIIGKSLTNIANELYLNKGGGFIARQVNCHGQPENKLDVFLAETFPDLNISYQEICQVKSPASLMGAIQVLEVNNEVFLVNYFAKVSRNDATSYDAIASSWNDMKRIQKSPIYIEYGVGCGNAAAEWEIYSTIVDFYRNDVVSCKARP